MAMEITSRSLADPETAEIISGKAIQPGMPAQLPVPGQSRCRRRILRMAPQLARRNFSSRANELSGGKAIILSIPKSGRTWIRTFLCAYFCKLHGRDFTLQPERYGDAGIPRLIFSHDLFEHRTKGDLWDKFRGKYLVPKRELQRAKIILLVRDPRDCFVSLYVQMTRRDPAAPAKFKKQTASDLLRHERFGIRSIIRTMNDWLHEFAGRNNFMIIRYEALRASPAEHFRELLAVLGETAPDMSIFHEALEFSEFTNMQKLEAAGAFDSKILRPGDVHDPESFKVRRGKIGGYREYLSTEDQEYASDALRELDARFGY
jgi:sulfotransferase family protein